MGHLHLRHHAVHQPRSLIDFRFRPASSSRIKTLPDDVGAFARRQIYDAPWKLAGHGDMVTLNPAIGLNQPSGNPLCQTSRSRMT